jgi:Fe-S-cluster containining protein
MSFGEFIKIERQMGPRDYYCRYGMTNEVFLAHIQPEYADAVSDDSFEQNGANTDAHPKRCIFMLKNPDGKGFACAIYPTRPSICREFRCYRMLIHHHPTGELRGRVMGINELKTSDEILEAIWKEKIAHLPHPYTTQHAQVQHSHSPLAQLPHGHDSHVHAHIHGLEHADDHEWVNNVITILAAHGYRGDPVV